MADIIANGKLSTLASRLYGVKGRGQILKAATLVNRFTVPARTDYPRPTLENQYTGAARIGHPGATLFNRYMDAARIGHPKATLVNRFTRFKGLKIGISGTTRTLVMRIIISIFYLATAILMIYIPRLPSLGLSSHRIFVDSDLATITNMNFQSNKVSGYLFF